MDGLPRLLPRPGAATGRSRVSGGGARWTSAAQNALINTSTPVYFANGERYAPDDTFKANAWYAAAQSAALDSGTLLVSVICASVAS